jgi:steroid delta-isomerase-like uncharacterized protein
VRLGPALVADNRACGGAEKRENVTMTRNEIQALVDRFVRAWAAEDLDGLLECYDEQAELISPLLHTVRGIDAIEGAHQDVFVAFSDIVLEVHDVVIDVENQRAVLVFTNHATQQGDLLGFPSSGRRFAAPMAFVFQFNNDRIVSERRLYDYGGLLMQLGILKTKSV